MGKETLTNLTDFKRELAALGTLREELKLKAHLARADLKSELDELERRWLSGSAQPKLSRILSGPPFTSAEASLSAARSLPPVRVNKKRYSVLSGSVVSPRGCVALREPITPRGCLRGACTHAWQSRSTGHGRQLAVE